MQKHCGDNDDADPDSTLKKLIEEMDVSPGFKRAKDYDGNTVLVSSNGQKFLIARIRNPHDEIIAGARALWERELRDEDEGLDQYDVFEEERIQDDDVIFLALVDADEDLIGLIIVTYLELSNGLESLALVAYIATEESYRCQGLATELYRVAYEYISALARDRKQRVVAVIEETNGRFEQFFNKLGRERIYFEGKDGNVYEVPYVQPPMIFDRDTGLPKSGTMKYHLMIRLTDDRQSLNIEALIEMVERIYNNDYLPPREFFSSDNAYDVCRVRIEQELTALRECLAFARRDALILLSFSAREKMTKDLARRNLAIIDYNT